MEFINTNFENWIRFRFYKDNHPKYHKYFDEWFSNITESQIQGFNKQMYNDINGILK
jgi:hypothetical protein